MNHPDDDTPTAAPADATQAEAKPVRRRRAPKAEAPAGDEPVAAPIVVEASEEAPAKPARKRRAAAAKPVEGEAAEVELRAPSLGEVFAAPPTASTVSVEPAPVAVVASSGESDSEGSAGSQEGGGEDA